MAKISLEDDGLLDDSEIWAVVDRVQAHSSKRPLSFHSPPVSLQKESVHDLSIVAASTERVVITEILPNSREPKMDCQQGIKRKSFGEGTATYGNQNLVNRHNNTGIVTPPRKMHRINARTDENRERVNERSNMNENQCWKMNGTVQMPPTHSNWQLARHSGYGQPSTPNFDRPTLREIPEPNVNLQLVCSTETMACQPHRPMGTGHMAERNNCLPPSNPMSSGPSWMANMPSAAAFKHFQQSAMEILEPTDYVSMQGGKPYIKKSGWRKIAFFFNISFEIKDRKIEYDDRGMIVRAEFVVRASMESGRFAEGWGTCDRHEKRFMKPNNDVPCMAETRAKNRASQDLLGIGELKTNR